MIASLALAMLALAGLSVQSVYREAQFRRRVIMDTHRNIADVVSARLDAAMIDTDRDIAGVLEGVAPRNEELLSALDRLESARPWLQPLVLTSFAEQPIASPHPTENDDFEQTLSTAERTEYRNQESDKAAQLYAAAVRQARNPSSRTAALNGQARTAFKSGDFQQASDAYKRLIAGTDVLDRQQALLSVIARDQLVSCYRSLRREPETAAAALELYDFLVSHRFIVGEETYEFYKGRVEPFLVETKTQAEAVRRLRSRDEKLNAVAAALRTNGTIARITAGAAGVEIAHLWDESSLSALLDHLLLERGSWSEVRIALVKDRPEGSRLTASSTAAPADVAKAALPLARAPGWRVAAFPKTDSLDGLASHEVVRFAALLTLVFGTVAAAMVLAARSVSRELALSRARSEFVANVSHELKTPLAAIRMFGESLREGWVGEEKKADYYEVIVRESERLTGLINNVLDFSRIESGRRKYQIAPADLRDILAPLLDRYHYHLKGAGIQLTCELPAEPVLALVDREAIEQVLVNLLSNAVKYMGPLDGRPREVVASLIRCNEEAVIRIADTGIGISEEDRQHIFDRFWRAGDDHVRGVAGSGLGLTLVKHIVEAHRGAIRVESTPGKGSTFAVWLPAAGVPS